MRLIRHLQLVLFCTSCALFIGCAKPILVIQATTDDLQLDFDAYVGITNDLEIAYDFWSPDGVPFISFLNRTSDTILLDLNNSRLILGRESKSVSLEDAISMQTDYSSYTTPYPDLTFKRVDRKMMLVLLPQKWASLYGPSCHAMRNIRRGEPIRFNYVYARMGSSSEIKHDFDLTAVTRISRKDVSAYERTEASPDKYFVDSEAGLNPNTTNIIVEVLLTILFAF